MCGRYVTPAEAEIERYWHIGAHDSGLWARGSFNVAPTSMVPILRMEVEGQLQLVAARWGLIPFWWKKAQVPSGTYNARSEEAGHKPMWRNSYRYRRCLMPALGWYEWSDKEVLHMQAGRETRQPYYLYCSTEPVLAFAALWSSWEAPNGDELLSCAMLTKSAAPSIRAIYGRMPVVLSPSQYDAWLAAETRPDEVAHLVASARTDLAGHRVSPLVNDTRNDFPALLEAL